MASAETGFSFVGNNSDLKIATKTRQKFKQAYDAEFLATIERCEKQIILARHGRRLVQLLDDSPIVPGEQAPAYLYATQARQILNDAEDDLRDWQLNPQDLMGPSLPASDSKSSIQTETESPNSSPSRTTRSRRLQRARAERTASTDEKEAADNNLSANPQGEHEPIQERGSERGSMFEAHERVDGNYLRINDTEALLPQSSQQLEGSTVLTGSPVSSADGWRVHANLFSPQQSSVAY